MTDAPTLTDVYDLGCGRLAFRYLGEIRYGDVMRSQRAVLLSGERPMTGEVIVCGSCGRELHTTDITLEVPR